MTIEVLEDGYEVYFGRDVEYNLNGHKWVSLKANLTSPTLKKGDLLSLRCSLMPGEGFGRFMSNGKAINLRGNVLSLIFKDDINLDISGYSYVFYNIFNYYYGNNIVCVEKNFLPATTLADYCYNGMFEGCTNLTTAPELPATTLADYCYNDMFRGCTNLTTAPELPATTLADYCYSDMFEGCTNLNYIKMLATDISAPHCLDLWVYGVSPIGIFVKSKDATWDVRGVNGIPEGWTVITDDYPTNSVGMPDSKEFGFPLFLNTEYLGETDYTIVMYRDVKDIMEPFASWFSQNTDGYGGVHSDVLYRDRIFIDGYIVTRMYYNQSLDSLMMETQKDYGNDSTIGISSDGNLYVTIVKQQVGGGVEISLNIDGRDYTAAKGMTWIQWVQSGYYNPSYGENKIYIVENTVYVYAYTGDWFLIGQNGSDFIIEGTRYKLYGPVPAPEL
jgi:hypothetical protein